MKIFTAQSRAILKRFFLTATIPTVEFFYNADLFDRLRYRPDSGLPNRICVCNRMCVRITQPCAKRERERQKFIFLWLAHVEHRVISCILGSRIVISRIVTHVDHRDHLAGTALTRQHISWNEISFRCLGGR